MPNVIILCGIPTSGKSTWALKQAMIGTYIDDFRRHRIISRDTIRIELYGVSYKHSSEKEKHVTEVFNSQLDSYIAKKHNIILDNTHCKELYLKEALNRFANTDYNVHIKFFDISLWKAYYRNIKRWLKTGKFIPFKVIRNMKLNYDKINKQKYAIK